MDIIVTIVAVETFEKTLVSKVTGHGLIRNVNMLRTVRRFHDVRDITENGPQRNISAALIGNRKVRTLPMADGENIVQNILSVLPFSPWSGSFIFHS